MGTGLTAPSRFLVRKSQKILGQKKPEREAASWSVFFFEKRLVVERVEERRDWGVEEGGRRTGCGGEDDEAGPVVFDEFAHCSRKLLLFFFFFFLTVRSRGMRGRCL